MTIDGEGRAQPVTGAYMVRWKWKERADGPPGVPVVVRNRFDGLRAAVSAYAEGSNADVVRLFAWDGMQTYVELAFRRPADPAPPIKFKEPPA